MPFRYPSLAERLLANSLPAFVPSYSEVPCWIWIGACVTNRAGKRYGKLTIRKKGKLHYLLAHRAAVVSLKGYVLRSRQVVRHLCNNSLCINPAHLAGGTQRQNVRQCVEEGRHRTPFRTAEAAT